MKNNYDLSIILVTYNHENYITQALESLFEQQLTESWELIIADDASQDNTLSIIKNFEKAYPHVHFQYLDSSINVGITKNYQRAFATCTGNYVAILEGDDYWPVNYKLQRQINFLKQHNECDLCSVNYFIYDEANLKFTSRTLAGQGYHYITAAELIRDNIIGNFSTCMYRKSALNQLPAALFNLCAYDWIINICIARHSLIGFLEEPMSVYRLHQNGTWSSLSQIEKLKEQKEIIPVYNALTENLFDREFKQLDLLLNDSIMGLLNKGSTLQNIRKTILRLLKPKKSQGANTETHEEINPQP